MKNVTENKPMILDLDAALEEVAKKLRPTSTGGCDTTRFSSDAVHTTGKGICGCTCCSGGKR